MIEMQSPYKQVSLKDAVTDAQVKRDLSALDEPWQPQKARLRMAAYLAFGLLILFGLTIACNGSIIPMLAIASIVNKSEPTKAITPMLDFAKMVLPYIATPLGVALGYFFRDTRQA
ncbi:MAG: hypothetical protein SVX38_05010 [Chloroflexota bacterium]|nr:hypothetical protein [Chloroflexota bacterium]